MFIKIYYICINEHRHKGAAKVENDNSCNKVINKT